MSSRRKFLRIASLGSVAALGNKSLFAKNENRFEVVKGNPVVVSTWNFGTTANIGAWDVLSKGGRALDAVEAGVKIPEADPD